MIVAYIIFNKYSIILVNHVILPAFYVQALIPVYFIINIIILNILNHFLMYINKI